MSAFSEIINSCLRGKSEGEDILTTLKDAGPPLGWEGLRPWVDWNVVNIVRPARYYFTGKKPWPDGETAMQETATYMGDAIYHFMIHSLSKGICAGVDPNKESEDFDWELLFTKKGEEIYKKSEDENFDFIHEDQDTMDLLREYLVNACATFVTLHSFRDAKDKQTLRVYDLWIPIIKSAAVSLYVVGIKTGEKCRDQMVIEQMEKEISGFPE